MCACVWNSHDQQDLESRLEVKSCGETARSFSTEKTSQDCGSERSHEIFSTLNRRDRRNNIIIHDERSSQTHAFEMTIWHGPSLLLLLLLAANKMTGYLFENINAPARETEKPYSESSSATHTQLNCIVATSRARVYAREQTTNDHFPLRFVINFTMAS